MSKYVWSLNLTTHAANQQEAGEEFEAFLEKHQVDIDAGRVGISRTKYGYDGEHKLTSKKEFEQRELKKKKRPKLCSVNLKGVHEWAERAGGGGSFCIHCDAQIKNRKKVKEQPVRCLISNVHKYETTDVNKWKFKCTSCGVETSLREIVKNIAEDGMKKSQTRSLPRWEIHPGVKNFLNNNGKPLGRSKITNEVVKDVFDTLYRRSGSGWKLR